ncbi:MAG: hypothetical protein NTZ17_20380 [Phycisphaerae bacterium]|nr:hypothetical protein [Phycisphaerae bacterium]
MAFAREGIENVRVLALPDGVAAEGRCAAVSGTALVTWHSSRETMYHQVYLNGRFAGSTLDAGQRRLVVHAPSSFQSAVHVEVIAVEPKEAHIDFSCELDRPATGSGRVRLTILRSQTLPIEATANVYFDNGTGQIDYTEPLNPVPIPIWPCRQNKAGFGMAQFGAGDFGYDSAAVVGFGKGSFGDGQFGLDADAIEWMSSPLPLGRYRFGIRIADARGNESPASETEAITVVPAAKPAAGLEIVTFNEQANQLTLRILE